MTIALGGMMASNKKKTEIILKKKGRQIWW